MKSIIFTIISALCLSSCLHQSFDEVSYHDIMTCKGSCIIASDIRNDLSGTHKKVYKDAQKIVEELMSDPSIEVISFDGTMKCYLEEKYPSETVEIVVNNLVEIYKDAQYGMDDLFVLPLVSLNACIENGITLSEIEDRPIIIPAK